MLPIGEALEIAHRIQPAWVVAIGFGLITLAVHGYRLSAGPDIFADEGLYLLVGHNLATGHGLVADKGPFYWHPPLYMLVEAAYIKGAGLAGHDPVQMLFEVRWLNVVFSAVTAGLLILIGRRLHSLKAGSITAALFLLDPYVQRINRRGMLETLAMLAVIVGLFIFITQRHHSRWRWFGSGLAFGFAALTKEAMLLQLLTLAGFAVWNRRGNLADAARAIAVALTTYASYVVWTIAAGQGQYLSYQLFGLSRLMTPFIGHAAMKPPPGANLLTSPHAQSIDNLRSLLPQYMMSYLLIFLAAVSTIIIVTFWQRREEARYLMTWSIVSFVCMGLLARVSDQFFYYVVVASTVVVGYTCMSALDAALATRDKAPTHHALKGLAPSAVPILWLALLLPALLAQYPMGGLLTALAAVGIGIIVIAKHRRPEVRYLAIWSLTGFAAMSVVSLISDQFFYYAVVPSTVVVGAVCMVVLDPRMARDWAPKRRAAERLMYVGMPALWLVLLLPIGVTLAGYNGYVWFTKYALGSDDSYTQVLNYVGQNVPPGSTIVVSNAVPKYFLPGYDIRFDREPRVVVKRHELYFIMSSKDRSGRNEHITPEFYDWMTKRSRALFVKTDDSFGQLGVFYRDSAKA